jgi:hypothetical protein
VGLRTWARENKAVAFSIVFTLVIVVAVGLYIWRHRVDKDENGPGSIESIVVLQGDDGHASLLLIEVVEHADDTSDWRNWRFTRLDPVFGKLIKRERIVAADEKDIHAMHCEGAGFSTSRPSRVWCKTDEHLELRDIYTMALITDDVKLARSSADLRSGIMADRTMIVDREKSDIEVQTKDGYNIAIHADNASVRRLEKRGEPSNGSSRVDLGKTRHADCIDADVYKPGADKSPTTEGLTVGGQPGPRVKVIMQRRQPEGAAAMSAPLGSESYLSGKILCEGGYAINLPTEDPNAPRTFVVVEKTSLDESQAKLRLVALDEQGKQRWDLKLDRNGTIHHAEIINNHVLLVVMGGKNGAVFGINPKNGQQSFLYDGTRR